MDVLLVDPLRETAYSCPSLGLMYLAGVLEERDVNVDIIEMRFLSDPWTDLKRVISERQPQVLGISSYSYTFPDAIKIAGITKHLDPHIKTVVGGPHVSATPEESIRRPEVDVVVVGEGEVTMLELVTTFENHGPLQTVKGILFKSNGVVRTPPRSLIRDLDDLPFPARHLVSMDRYHALEDTTTVITSRGCPYDCVFCASRAMWGPEVRLRRPENVVDEVEQVANTYNFNVIGFADDVFTLNTKRTMRLCRELRRRGLGVEWECSTRTDLLSKQLLAAMKKAGCRALFLGVESGCQDVLNRIAKGTTVEQTEKVVTWAKEAGIETRLSFMLGCPGETKETVNKTLRFARKLRKLGGGTVTFSLLKPYPGTEVFTQPEKFGISSIDTNWGRKHGAPLVSTCETNELSRQERAFIAWIAGEIERNWNTTRIVE